MKYNIVMILIASLIFGCSNTEQNIEVIALMKLVETLKNEGGEIEFYSDGVICRNSVPLYEPKILALNGDYDRLKEYELFWTDSKKNKPSKTIVLCDEVIKTELTDFIEMNLNNAYYVCINHAIISGDKKQVELNLINSVRLPEVTDVYMTFDKNNNLIDYEESIGEIIDFDPKEFICKE